MSTQQSVRKPRRGLAITAIVLSAILIVVSLAAVVGVWVVQARLSQAVNRAFDLPDKLLSAAVVEIDQWVSAGQLAANAVDELSGEVQKINDTVQDRPVILGLINELTNGKLIPALQRVNAGGQAIYDKLNQAQSNVRTMRSLLFFTGSQGQLDEIDEFLSKWIGELEQLNESVNSFIGAVQGIKEQTAQAVTDALLRPLQRINEILARMGNLFETVRSAAIRLQAGLSAARVRILNLIATLAVLLTLFFLFLIASQAFLIYYSIQDLRQAPAGAALETASAQAALETAPAQAALETASAQATLSEPPEPQSPA